MRYGTVCGLLINSCTSSFDNYFFYHFQQQFFLYHFTCFQTEQLFIILNKNLEAIKKTTLLLRIHFCFYFRMNKQKSELFERKRKKKWIIIIYAKLSACHSFIRLVSWVPISIRLTRAFIFFLLNKFYGVSHQKNQIEIDVFINWHKHTIHYIEYFSTYNTYDFKNRVWLFIERMRIKFRAK